jgi:superfamily II DNA or RNA helicase
MEVNTKRNEVQKLAIQAFKECREGILHIAMGVGKTKIGIDISKDYQKVLIVAPYVALLESWKEEYRKWNVSDLNVAYTTTASLKKYKDLEFDLIILDEIHLFSFNQLEKIPKGKRLGLSGTISLDTAKYIKETIGLSVVFNYNLEAAIKDKVIADYRIKIVDVFLDDTEKYIQAGTKKKPFLTTERKQYDYLTSNFNKLKFAEWGSIGEQAKKLRLAKMQVASKRAKLIYSCKSKLKAAKEVIEKFNDDRILIFSTLTESANYLSEFTHHSKSRITSLQKFSEGKIDKLAVVNMVNVGLNIKPLHKAVVHQLQSSPETAKQRIGRLLRLEYDNPGKVGEIWIIRAMNTIDEQWVKSALTDIPSSKIEYIHYNNLKHYGDNQTSAEN